MSCESGLDGVDDKKIFICLGHGMRMSVKCALDHICGSARVGWRLLLNNIKRQGCTLGLVRLHYTFCDKTRFASKTW